MTFIPSRCTALINRGLLWPRNPKGHAPPELVADAVVPSSSHASRTPVPATKPSLAHPLQRLHYCKTTKAVSKALVPAMNKVAELQAAAQLDANSGDKSAAERKRLEAKGLLLAVIDYVQNQHVPFATALQARLGEASALHTAIAMGDEESALLLLNTGMPATPLLDQRGAFNFAAHPTIMLAIAANMPKVVAHLRDETVAAITAARNANMGAPSCRDLALHAAQQKLYGALFAKINVPMLDAFFNGSHFDAVYTAFIFGFGDISHFYAADQSSVPS